MPAINLTAYCCDLSPAAPPPARHPSAHHYAVTPQHCAGCCSTSPARVIRTGRQLILRLPAGYQHADSFQATLDAIYALPPP